MFKNWIKLALMLVLVKICILEKTPHDSGGKTTPVSYFCLAPKRPNTPPVASPSD